MNKYNNAVDSVTADLVSGGAGSTTTILDLGSGQSFKLTDYDVSYASGSAQTALEVWDAPSGTTAGNLSATGQLVAYIPIIGGEHDIATNITRMEFDNSVVINQPSAQNGEAWLTIGGHYVSM